MGKYNPYLKEAILQVVTNQLHANDPPEVKETLERLISEGISKQQAIDIIGAVVSAHIYDILKEQHEFDKAKYVNDLNKLPKLPWE